MKILSDLEKLVLYAVRAESGSTAEEISNLIGEDLTGVKLAFDVLADEFFIMPCDFFGYKITDRGSFALLGY